MVDESEDASEPTLHAPEREMEERKRRETESTRLNERLQDLDRARAEFVANVSREFRTPLMLLLGPLQDILGSPASALAPASRQAGGVRRNALRLLRLVDRLLDFSDIEGGRPGAASEPTDLAAFTAGFRQFPFGRVGGFDPPRGLSTPAGAGLRESRHVGEDRTNLVANAFKSTVEGTIEVRCALRGRQVQLGVRDTGNGIAEGELPYVFRHFQRIAGARAGDSGDMTQASGWRWCASWCNSKRDRSMCKASSGAAAPSPCCWRSPHASAFSARPPHACPPRACPPRASAPARLPSPVLPAPVLPGAKAGSGSAPVSAPLPASAFAAEALLGLPAATAPAYAHLPTSATVSSRRGRVVVAEDDAEMRAYLGDVLGAAGFIVDALADGTAALASCQARPPDVLVSDVSMPGLNGFELIERLRADERTAVIPVLLLSGRAGEDSRIEGIAAGRRRPISSSPRAVELVARVEARFGWATAPRNCAAGASRLRVPVFDGARRDHYRRPKWGTC
jgi:CheY-like chemotaxis protein